MNPFRIETLEIEAMQPLLKGAVLQTLLTRTGSEERQLGEFAARIQHMAGHDVALIEDSHGNLTDGMLHAFLHALRMKTRRQQGEPLSAMTLRDAILLRLRERTDALLPLPLPGRIAICPLHPEESQDLEMQELRPGIQRAVQTTENLL